MYNLVGNGPSERRRGVSHVGAKQVAAVYCNCAPFAVFVLELLEAMMCIIAGEKRRW